MKKITINLTDEQLYDLFILVQENMHTGNKEWDKNMKEVHKKLQSKI